MKSYLGDGVYVEALDYGTAKMMANDSNIPSDTIYLESKVIDSFLNFIQTMRGNDGSIPKQGQEGMGTMSVSTD